MKHLFASLRFCVLFLLITAAGIAQIPAPKDTLGFTPGDDRKLASWTQTVEYFKALDKASDRVMFQEIGKTTMGAPFVYATISSPANLREIKKYKDINAKLADPRKLGSKTPPSASSAAVRKLIAEGKTIVLITCGIHSTEVGSSLSSMLIAYRLANGNDAETKKILDNTIVLLVPSLNPDGVDIVKNWYDKTLGTKFEGTTPPELYHKYVGHDNNRDWYAFTQIETQLTVDKIHNVWHPQIVHDIHQQGANGSRLFLPPYMEPVEPNVPKQLVEAYNQLGNAMAADLRKKGVEGITTNSTYDAWTPARAYSHYHGGVRILSETASARLASPVTIKFEELRGGQGYDAKKASDNFGPVWKGGEWTIGDVTRTMTTAAFSLLNHAADNRELWLSRFYEIGKEAVRPRKEGELWGFRLKAEANVDQLLRIFDRAGVEYNFPKGESETTARLLSYFDSTRTFPAVHILVPYAQPYGAYVKAVLEEQEYPNLADEKGNPIAPYDVTAHSLGLLMNVSHEELIAPFNANTLNRPQTRITISDCAGMWDKKGLYKSHVPSMDEGWTRWVLEKKGICEGLESVTDTDVRQGNLEQKKPSTGRSVLYKTIIFPDQPANQILNGYAKGSMPDEYVGGVGKEGVANLKKFVEDGGTLVFLNDSSDFAIEQFNLPIKDVTKGLSRKDFYIPGSILRTELDLTHPIAKGMPRESIAWFEGSPAFEIPEAPKPVPGVETVDMKRPTEIGDVHGIRVIARYPTDPKKILLSGWALGTEKIAGKAALVEVSIGKGKIILFGFRPQYRGQSLATFPLLFNAIGR